MRIVCDTREKQPYAFPGLETITKALPVGDYAIEGFEDGIVLERKSLNDFVNTVIGDWPRFVECLKRMRRVEYAAIIVEAEIDDVVTHRYESRASASAVLGRANSISVNWGVPVFFWSNRQECQMMAASMLSLFWERKQRQQRKGGEQCGR